MAKAAGAVIAALVFAAEPPPTAPFAGTAAAETFDLDIAEKRIHREGFEASTALRLESDGGGVALRVGASVSARVIDVVLRNVRGTVRFHVDTRRLDALADRAGAQGPINIEVIP